MVKHEQSNPPDPEQPLAGQVYKIASYCDKCRWHIDVCADYMSGLDAQPCQKSDGEYPLHHFVFLSPKEAAPTNGLGSAHSFREYKFQCSAPRCPLLLTISMRPPRLTDHHISLLTNKAILRRRLEAAKALAGERTDSVVARPIEALDFLRTYLTDALNPQKGKTRIPLLNRKFLKTFGQDCDEIFHKLGFTFESEPLDEVGRSEERRVGKECPV